MNKKKILTLCGSTERRNIKAYAAKKTKSDLNIPKSRNKHWASIRVLKTLDQIIFVFSSSLRNVWVAA